MRILLCFFLSGPRLQQSVAAPPPRQWADGALRLVEPVEGRAVAPGRQSGSRSLRVHTCYEAARCCHRDVLISSDSLLWFVTFSSVIQSREWTTRPSALWRLCFVSRGRTCFIPDPLVFLPCRQNLSKFGSKTEIPSRSIRWRWTTATVIWKAAWWVITCLHLLDYYCALICSLITPYKNVKGSSVSRELYVTGGRGKGQVCNPYCCWLSFLPSW